MSFRPARLIAVSTRPAFPPANALRLLALALLAGIFAGCATTVPSKPIGVTSPPPPAKGSAPIMAYDDFARALNTEASSDRSGIVPIASVP